MAARPLGDGINKGVPRMIYEETFSGLICDTKVSHGGLGPDMEVTLNVVLDVQPVQYDDDEWDFAIVGETFEIEEVKNLDTGELYYGPGFCPLEWRGTPQEVWEREWYCGYLEPVPELRARFGREWDEILARQQPGPWPYQEA